LKSFVVLAGTALVFGLGPALTLATLGMIYLLPVTIPVFLIAFLVSVIISKSKEQNR
jgi:hypothetical protein